MNGDDKEDIGSQNAMDINVIILMFPNPTFSGNMVTCKASANAKLDSGHCVGFPVEVDGSTNSSIPTELVGPRRKSKLFT